MADDRTNVLEFNSNVAVLQRVDKIINAINDARFRATRFDIYGQVQGEPEEIVTHLVGLYKEISVELTVGEKQIWGKLKALRDKLRINPPKSSPEKRAYWMKTIADVDDIDLEVRASAKKHGFLSANKRDVKKAALRS